MATTAKGVSAQQLGLPEELILMLLSEENGHFYQVPGWDLNRAVAGAVLAELSLMSRIDTDMESLFLVDQTKTGNPALDAILKEIAGEPTQRNAQYWIERLVPQAESIIDSTLDRLVDLKVLEHHDGDFWTLSPTAWQTDQSSNGHESSEVQFVKTRISRAIFNNEIPGPRDVIIICLVNTCDVFRFIFQLDDQAEERIQAICKMDLIGRSIADAVAQNRVGPLLRRSAITKKIPTVSLGKLLFNRYARSGNLPALFGHLAEKYGRVFKINPPLAKPMTFLAGPETNEWVHRRGRMYLRTRDYFSDFEAIYGVSGVLPSLGWRRPFPAAQGHAASVFPRKTGRATGQSLPLSSEAYGRVDGWRHRACD